MEVEETDKIYANHTNTEDLTLPEISCKASNNSLNLKKFATCNLQNNKYMYATIAIDISPHDSRRSTSALEACNLQTPCTINHYIRFRLTPRDIIKDVARSLWRESE